MHIGAAPNALTRSLPRTAAVDSLYHNASQRLASKLWMATQTRDFAMHSSILNQMDLLANRYDELSAELSKCVSLIYLHAVDMHVDVVSK